MMTAPLLLIVRFILIVPLSLVILVMLTALVLLLVLVFFVIFGFMECVIVCVWVMSTPSWCDGLCR